MNTIDPKTLPLYTCHKQVRAAKIDAVDFASQTLGLENFGTVQLRHEFFARNKPQVGGYFVQYEDGYQSYSPKKAFEEGYALSGEPFKPLNALELGVAARAAGPEEQY